MNKWGEHVYGDPCRECGFRWSISLSDGIELVRGVPGDFASVLGAASGAERHPDLGWPVVAYVCHVADNLHIWAERLARVARGADLRVAPFDQDELAAARHYDEVSLQGASWSLERSVADWLDAVALAAASPAVADGGAAMVHAEHGPLSLVEVARLDAHDALHHVWDVRRTLERAG